MTVREQGFLLLSGYLGDPERKPLTIPQLRKLAQMARKMEKPTAQRELTKEDLMAIGCEPSFACRVIELLSQEDMLRWYIDKGRRAGCTPITRVTPQYPGRLRLALGEDAPGVLWLKGNCDLLDRPAISVVGSRNIHPDNLAFADAVGRMAAVHGYALVSGNARGADQVAQNSCLAHGGGVISVVADVLSQKTVRGNVLYVSEEGFDLPFSAQRALQRNRIIHSLSPMTFVAQCTVGKGGTWSGTCDNLRHGRSKVICFDDGSDAVKELVRRGAMAVSCQELESIC